MKYYFAPMEGITGYVYRNAHKTFFPHIDKYFAPFLVPTQNKKLSQREKNDILPEHNEGIFLVPQILTNRAEDFIWASLELKNYGYEEVNINLGCPSKTVVSKKRGAGFLKDLEGLNTFFDQVFSALPMKVSVKTRLGMDNPDEFYRLIEIYNQYPIKELIIHPRIQKDYYNNTPNLAIFKDALSKSLNPVCYNGNLFTSEAYHDFAREFPEVEQVMMGRGLLSNPGLAGQIKGEKPVTTETLEAFHSQILSGYEKIMSGDRNVLFKMKELWAYMLPVFEDSKKIGKCIRKAQHLTEYREAVNGLFRSKKLLL